MVSILRGIVAKAEIATPHEVMSITGHQTLEEVERYTRTAKRRILAGSAMDRLT